MMRWILKAGYKLNQAQALTCPAPGSWSTALEETTRGWAGITTALAEAATTRCRMFYT